jgi:hypothetical protein
LAEQSCSLLDQDGKKKKENKRLRSYNPLEAQILSDFSTSPETPHPSTGKLGTKPLANGPLRDTEDLNHSR